MTRRQISRRAAIAVLASLPAGIGLGLACGDDEEPAASPASRERDEVPLFPKLETRPEALPTATPPPFVVEEGEERRLLMADSPYETALHILGSGLPGEVLMVLGGVHGNEPGGWLAAERIVEDLRPAQGALLVVPHANQQATELFVRTTDEMGDLNRLYPGDPPGPPMAQMAHELVEAMRAFHVSLVLDLHESWSFFKGRTQSGTAFLGQTVTTLPGEPGTSIAQGIVNEVNQRIEAPHEELFFRNRSFASRARQFWPTGGGSTSSLGLPNFVPGLSAILIEMGQQQALERRVAIHVEVVKEGMQLLGIRRGERA